MHLKSVFLTGVFDREQVESGYPVEDLQANCLEIELTIELLYNYLRNDRSSDFIFTGKHEL